MMKATRKARWSAQAQLLLCSIIQGVRYTFGSRPPKVADRKSY